MSYNTSIIWKAVEDISNQQGWSTLNENILFEDYKMKSNKNKKPQETCDAFEHTNI